MSSNIVGEASANHPPSERTTIKRMPHRAVYDRAVINAILDEGLVCHLGFTVDSQPYVLPAIYARETLIDGLVLARSAYHHSINYRSVVILGTATEICDRTAKLAALRTIVNHVIRGRWDEVRAPSEGEIRSTVVLSLPVDEASAKVRTGPPLDDEEDYALRIWAGVLPLSLDAHGPIADPQLPADIAAPMYVRFYRRKPLPAPMLP